MPASGHPCKRSAPCSSPPPSAIPPRQPSKRSSPRCFVAGKCLPPPQGGARLGTGLRPRASPSFPRIFPALQPPNPPFQKGGFLFLRFELYRFSFLLQGLRKCPHAGNLAKFIEKRFPANTGNQSFFPDVVYTTPFCEIKS